MRSVLSAVRQGKRFIVTMHVNPDADAVASAVAFTLFLRSKGKKVRLVNQDACPGFLGFLPQSRLYERFDEQKHAAFKADTLVVLDCGSVDRIGTVQKLATPGVKVLNIDHHITNTSFGDINFVLPACSSTCEILATIFKRAGCRLNRDLAVLLYVGIMTDTGSFGFDSTSPHTHQVVSELLRYKFSVSELYRKIYETMPKNDLKAFFALMNRMELFEGDRVACLQMTQKDAKVFSNGFDLKDKIFTFLRSVEGLEVIVILTELEKDKTRLNFRSRGAFDVAKLAGKFGGGGHKKASGGLVDANFTRAKTKVLAAIRKAL